MEISGSFESLKMVEHVNIQTTNLPKKCYVAIIDGVVLFVSKL